jgi:hypothetical protein
MQEPGVNTPAAKKDLECRVAKVNQKRITFYT